MRLKRPALSLFAVAATTATVSAAVPTYRVDVVATYNTTTTVRGAGDAGFIIGDTIELGLSQPFIASLDDGLTILPLPDGYLSGAALDVNDQGVVVGTVSDTNFAFDFGEPAVWTPDGAGGYDVMIPQQLQTVTALGQQMSVSGGQAVAINNAGQIVGWSRIQGFQGGPTTEFFVADAPVNLSDAGFTAQVRDLSDTGIIVGGGLRMDLDTGATTALGLPDPIQPGNVGFTDVIAYAVNDSGEAVVAANLASVPTENYLTYLHNDLDGYIRLNPTQLPSRFVGFYDNNNAGDVSASGGVLFRAENTLVQGYASLLEPGSTNWTVALGFIADDRRVFTTAHDLGADINAIVQLTPLGDPADLNADGSVNSTDLAMMLGAWGQPGPTDLNGDGVTDSADLAFLLGSWSV